MNRSIPELAKSLRSGNLEERIGAAQALGAYDNEESLTELVRALGARNHNVSLAAVKSLGAIASGASIRALIGALDNRQILVQCEVKCTPLSRQENDIFISG
jgi:HEAT repeat protein